MIKRIKLLSLVFTAVFVMALLIGCVADELTVYNGMIKAHDIQSMESKTDLTLHFESKGFPKDQEESMLVAEQIINNMKVGMNQKFTQNVDKTKIKQQMDLSYDVGGIATGFSMWADSDVSVADKPKFQSIIKIPQIFTAVMPTGYKGKPYLVINSEKLIQEKLITEKDLSKMLSLNKELSVKLTDFLKEYVLEFNAGFPVVSFKESKQLNGESVRVYEMKLNDTTFKALAKYSVNHLSKNEKALGMIKDIFTSMSDLATTKIATDSAIKLEQEDPFTTFNKDLKDNLDKISKGIDVFKDIQLIGNKGIVIDFAVNNEGYIVNESGTIDLYLDVRAIAEAGEKMESDKIIPTTGIKPGKLSGVILMTLDFNTAISNINKNIEIQFPTLTEKNSFDIMEMSKGAMMPYLGAFKSPQFKNLG